MRQTGKIISLLRTGDAWMAWVHHGHVLRNILTSHAHGRTASLTRMYIQYVVEV